MTYPDGGDAANWEPMGSKRSPVQKLSDEIARLYRRVENTSHSVITRTLLIELLGPITDLAIAAEQYEIQLLNRMREQA
jgi:hypothetical protein